MTRNTWKIRNTIATAALVAATALALPVLATGPAAAETEVMAAARDTVAERNRQLVTEAFDRWAAGGSGFFDEMLSPDIVWTIEGSGPSAGTYRGRQDFTARAVRPFVSRLSSPVRPVSKTVWADGDHVIIAWKGEATARDGAAYRNSYAWIFRMEDGKAVEATAFLDLIPYDDVKRRIPAPEGEGQ